MSNEYPFPNLDRIVHQNLRSAVARDIFEKRRNMTFMSQQGAIQYPSSNYAAGQLRRYEGDIIAWASLPNEGTLGHAFALLLKDMITLAVPNMQVISTPSTVDFLENNLSHEWGPSVDLLLGGFNADGTFTPQVAVDATLKGSRPPKYFHDKLQAPIAFVQAQSLLGRDFKDKIMKYGKSGASKEYLEQITSSCEDRLISFLNS